MEDLNDSVVILNINEHMVLKDYKHEKSLSFMLYGKANLIGDGHFAYYVSHELVHY